MRQFVSIAILLAFCIGCTNTKSRFETELINNKWILFSNGIIDLEASTPAWYIMFHENNTFESYHMWSDTKAPVIDEIPVVNWSYDNYDKQLNVGGHVFKVTSVKGDTIKLYNDSLSSKALLLKLTDKLKHEIMSDTICKGG